MNLRNVLKTYSLLRTLNDDETALLNTLRGMNEGERELLIEGLSPEKKLSKKTGDAKKRNLEHCGVCDYTRRAAHHKDTGHKDYHEFQSGKPKSQRASSLQQQIQGRARAAKETGNGDDQFADYRCTASLPVGGERCTWFKDDVIHSDTSYANHHEFQPAEQAASASGGD